MNRVVFPYNICVLQLDFIASITILPWYFIFIFYAKVSHHIPPPRLTLGMYYAMEQAGYLVPVTLSGQHPCDYDLTR
jgi:hypothetical protein